MAKEKDYSDVKILKMSKVKDQGAIKAFFDVQIDETLIIKGIRVVQGLNGLKVRLPFKQGRDGQQYSLVSPASKEVANHLNEAIIKAYKA